MKILSKIILIVSIGIFITSGIATACDTTTRLKLNSSGYSGEIVVELRKGNRPGSRVISRDVIITAGQRDFANVCPGKYFFSFATADSPTISVTSYFDVESNLELAEMTVFLSRKNDTKGNRVQTVKKNEL